MADITYKTFGGQVALMPMRCLSFYLTTANGYADTHFLDIYHLEAESSFNLKPIKKKDHRGNQRTLGWNFEGTFYIPHNVYKDNGLTEYLEEIRVKGFDLQLIGGSDTPFVSAGIPRQINSTDGYWLDLDGKGSLDWEIESVELRPRLTIHIAAFIKNIINGTGKNKLYWGE